MEPPCSCGAWLMDMPGGCPHLERPSAEDGFPFLHRQSQGANFEDSTASQRGRLAWMEYFNQLIIGNGKSPAIHLGRRLTVARDFGKLGLRKTHGGHGSVR